MRFFAAQMVRKWIILLQLGGRKYIFFRVGDCCGDSGAILAERRGIFDTFLVFFYALSLDLVVLVEGKTLILFLFLSGG